MEHLVSIIFKKDKILKKLSYILKEEAGVAIRISAQPSKIVIKEVKPIMEVLNLILPLLQWMMESYLIIRRIVLDKPPEYF